MRWRGVPNEDYTLILQDAAGKELWKGRGKPEGTSPGVALAPGGRYGKGVLPNGTPTGGNWTVVVDNLPGLLGGSYDSRRLHINNVRDVP